MWYFQSVEQVFYKMSKKPKNIMAKIYNLNIYNSIGNRKFPLFLSFFPARGAICNMRYRAVTLNKKRRLMLGRKTIHLHGWVFTQRCCFSGYRSSKRVTELNKSLGLLLGREGLTPNSHILLIFRLFFQIFAHCIVLIAFIVTELKPGTRAFFSINSDK